MQKYYVDSHIYIYIYIYISISIYIYTSGSQKGYPDKDIHFLSISVQIIFKALVLDEVTQSVKGMRGEIRSKDCFSEELWCVC